MLSVFVHQLIDPSGSSLRWLEERGVKVERGYPMWEHPQRYFSDDELIARAKGHVAIMGASDHVISRTVLEALPELRIISKYGIGVDSIDVRAATERGILVTNTPVAENYEIVAESTISLMLALLKKLNIYNREYMRAGHWRSEGVWTHFMRGRVIGFIGFGRIAREVAKRLQGWQVELLAYDPYIKEPIPGVELIGLTDLLQRADIVSLHAVATAENQNMIDAEKLALMKPTALLVNTARGSLVNLDDLSQALAEGRLAGAGIDVYPVVPPPKDHRIFALPNVIATPHTASWCVETSEIMGQVGAENLWAALSGQTPAYPVNPEVLRDGAVPLG